MFIVLFHELGHILSGMYFKIKIDRIVILPFGALTIFNTFINTKLYKEFFIAISGPLLQTILFFTNNQKLLYYNKLILLFNLLPIYPLDGSKIINIFLNKFFSFKKSYNISICISFFLIFVLIIYKHNLMSLIIIFLLLKKNIELIIIKKNIFNRFLLERYLYKLYFKKRKTINKISDMKKDYKHLFFINNKYKTEEEILNEMFDK